MADKIHLNKLKQGVDAWNTWRLGNPDIKPDLCNAELHAEELSGINLSETNLSEANLHNAYLSHANLKNANLSHANLNHATLNDANLKHANMSVSNMDYVHLENADLTAASLSYASLEEAYLLRANLYRANLSNTKLTAAYLHKTNLNNANLDQSHLARANLSHAQLVKAELSSVVLANADLSNANLTGAKLHDVDFVNANMSFANLRSANLKNVNFENVELCNTLLVDVDLTGITNIDTCRHRASSFVDFQTLEQSGSLPAAFLQGCGLSAKLIENWPQILHHALAYYSCHICYSEKDKKFVLRLIEQLQLRGIRCWADERKKYPGDTESVKVDRAIKPWDKVLLCCSESSLGSEWLDAEVEHFENLSKSAESTARPVSNKDDFLFPLNLDGKLTSGYWVSGKSHVLKARMVADFAGWEDANEQIFLAAFENLLTALQRR